ncbi:sigma-70 family RNA polymerase sigma factor [Colidextribacter sp. OB.20]|uniref:RNA polymerase sigma factor n=1 Tax=Colidextribacter sp. OB.20 TaxID=2304568 RepID=UPI00136E8272|nr:sigma-70 family RNA polymerase sigma factor [Colidextribacter sp. OB.20]NBI10064.1 sigma-70 family RNA polymerase sigma factor [Colidextribacter sp. OB.20]
MGEQEIIQLIRDRDHRGMDELLLHFGPLMRYIIAPILSDGRDREECLSEAAMRAWEKIELFNPEQGSWKGWLTALTRNAALNRARGLRGEVGELTEDIPSPAPMPEEALLRKERAEELKKLLYTLSYKDRALLYRKYYYMQSTQQIARELGTTPRAVEGRLYRLKQQLKKRLGGENYG